MPINKVTDKNGKPVKRDGKIKYRVRVNYTDSYGNSKQIERTAYGADEAKQLERELSHSVKEETPTKKMTFGQLCEEYLAVNKHETKETTHYTNLCRITMHVLPTFEKVRIDRINLPALQQWKQSLNEGSLSTGTKRAVFKAFSAVLNYAVKMEYISKNPLNQVGNFKAPLEEVKEMLFYTPEEFKLYISAAQNEAEKYDDLLHWSYYVFFCLAFYTGMRRGEILALNWNDVKNGEINITKSLTQSLKGSDRITSPKNKSSIRRIQIPNPLQKVLDNHYERCKKVTDFSDTHLICGGNRALRTTPLNKANNRYAEKGNVKRIRIHDFRHSHASLLANNGINIQEVARRLGHSNITITLKTYAHLYPKETERALNVLNQITL